MRILLVSEDVPHPAMGGLGKHAVTLARELAAEGHQVDFMGSRRFPYDDAARAQMALPGEFFADLRWRFGGWKEQALGFFNPVRRAVLARDFARIITARARDYDVIHYHGHVPDVAAFVPADVNFVQTRHDQGSDCLVHTRFRQGGICTETDPAACAGCIGKTPPGPIRRSLSASAVRQYRERVKRGFRTHKVVFVSEMLRRNFARTAGKEKWGAVVHNFLSEAALRQAMSGLGPAETGRARIELFVAGKLYAPKGIEPLLARLHGRLPEDMVLRIAGDGSDEYEAHLRTAYASERIIFLGWQEYGETLRLTARADVIVVPSACEESCPTTVLEALALGKPIHALDQGGTPELQRYERYPGQLRLHPDMDALAAAVLRGERAPPVDLSLPFAGDVADRVKELLQIYRLNRATLAACTR